MLGVSSSPVVSFWLRVADDFCVFGLLGSAATAASACAPGDIGVPNNGVRQSACVSGSLGDHGVGMQIPP